MLTVLTILRMLTVLYSYSNANNYGNSADTNYARNLLTIPTTLTMENTNSADTNYTIYASKLVAIPTLL